MKTFFSEMKDNRKTDELRITVPETGITYRSILIVWNMPSGTESGSRFSICLNGTEAGVTGKTSFTLRGLLPDTEYSIQVRLIRDQDSSLKTEFVRDLNIRTKPKGDVLNVKDFGTAGDGMTRDTEAVQRAVDACGRNGVVYIPPGIYRIDSIRLKSDMVLYLEKDAVLSLIEREREPKYVTLEASLPGPNGEVPYSSMGALVGMKLRDVTIMGQGSIQGNGETWWKHVSGYRGPRPLILELLESENILVQGITCLDSPSWNLHPLYCDTVVFNQVTIVKQAAGQANNGDGINPDSCRNVLITDCVFGTHDDCIAVKSGKLDESNGFKPQRPCEDVVIRDCYFNNDISTGHTGGIALGSEMSGSIRNVFVMNCEWNNVNHIMDIRTMRCRGGSISGIFYKNIRYKSTREYISKNRKVNGVISINMIFWEPDTLDWKPVTETTPRVYDITLEDIEIHETHRHAVCFRCLAESPGRNIILRNLRARTPGGLRADNVENMDLQDVHFLIR